MRIGGRDIGPEQSVYVIAEVGVNHDGDVERALELIDRCAVAGADAVKFQTFDPDALAVPEAPLAGYQRERSPAASQVDMLRQLALTAGDFEQLARRCSDRGVDFLSTPFDERSAESLVELGVPAIKVGSGELTNVPFLRMLGRFGLPMLISTGMADMGEIDRARAAAGDTPVALLHCVSSYPTPPEQANLRALQTLRDRYGGVVGYSDHCLGLEASEAAAALGADILERHVTLDRSAPGPDHAISLLPDELAELIERVPRIRSMLGDGEKRPQAAERDTARVARRSLVAARELRAGEVVDATAVAVKRPAGGLDPGRWDELLGVTLRRDMARDAAFDDDDLT